MTRVWLFRLSILLTAILLAVPCSAYDVFLKNGKVLHGTLIRESAETMILKDSSGMWMNVKKAEVDLEKTAATNKNEPQQPSAAKKARVVTKEDLEKLKDKYDLGLGTFGEATPLNLEEVPEGNTEQDADFELEVLQANGPVLVEFWAPWCGPCRAIAPDLEALATEFEGKAKIHKVNVDEKKALARSYKINAIPALLFFLNGEQVDQIIGVVPKDTIREKLESLL